MEGIGGRGNESAFKTKQNWVEEQDGIRSTIKIIDHRFYS